MAIAPLQLPGQFQSPDLNLYGSLTQLGQQFKKAQSEQKLSDLGKQLASGTVDYRQAAAQTADMGDITHTLQFLALAEQQKKQGLEQAAAANFQTGLRGLYGAQPSAAPPTANPMPQPGAVLPGAPVNVPPATAPMAMDRAPVLPTAKVWGDKEAEEAGLYEPKPGASPVRVASLAPQTASDARPVTPAPATIAQAVPPAVAAASAAPSTVTQPGAQHVPILLQALANPNLPAGQKETAKILLTEAFKNMKEPEKIQTLRAMKADPSLAELEMKLKAAGKTEVNVDTKRETELAKKLGGGLGERINDIAKEGDAARTDLAMVGQLRDLGAAIKTGGPAAVQGWLANYGIKVGENVGSVEAYGSIVDKLTPNQRVPGSGSSSDIDVKMFKSSLPRLINTPEGNTIIENTLAGLAQYKIERAAIAEKVQTEEITAKDALKLMRELPNPYENFKNFAKSGFRADPNNPASAVPPANPAAAPAKPVKFTEPEIAESLSNAKAAIAKNPAARDAIIKKVRASGLSTDGL